MSWPIGFGVCLVLAAGLAAWSAAGDRKMRKRPAEVQAEELRTMFRTKVWGPKDEAKLVEQSRCGLPLQQIVEIAEECGYSYTGVTAVARATYAWEFRPSAFVERPAKVGGGGAAKLAPPSDPWQRAAAEQREREANGRGTGVMTRLMGGLILAVGAALCWAFASDAAQSLELGGGFMRALGSLAMLGIGFGVACLGLAMLATALRGGGRRWGQRMERVGGAGVAAGFGWAAVCGVVALAGWIAG